MRIDLDTVGVKGAMSVERVRRVLIQCVPVDGSPSTAVVEVKRAFSPSSPSASFSSTQTLTLDGSAITAIDVTDTAWIHLVCTTAESGIRVNVEIETRGSVDGMAFEDTYDLADTGPRGTVDVSRRRRAFVMLRGDESNSAVLEIKKRIGTGTNALSFSSAVTPTIDGSTITEIDTDEPGFLVPVCTTSQSEQRARVWWYVRDEVESDRVRGTAFPSNPYDGQRFTRTDLNYETFTWDAGREKWLGDLVSWSFSRAGSQTGTFGLRVAGAEYWTTTQGIATPNALTWVGYRLCSKQAFTANIEAREGSSTLIATEATGSSSTIHSSDDVDIDFDADTSTPHKWWRVSVTSGTSDGLVGTVYCRRNATGE